MSIITNYTCDRCGATITETKYGLWRLETIVYKAPTRQAHLIDKTGILDFCSRQCLMMWLNQYLDQQENRASSAPIGAGSSQHQHKKGAPR